MRTARVLVLLALGAVIGCAPQDPPPEPVEPAETLVVYSLDPWVLFPGDEQDLEAGQAVFQRHIVLGSVFVTDPTVQREILGEVQKGIEEAPQVQELGDRLLGGFMPRYGLHHVAKDGTVTDWLICFGTRRVREFRNGELIRVEIGVGEKMWRDIHRNTTLRSESLLDDTLRVADVRLAD